MQYEQMLYKFNIDESKVQYEIQEQEKYSQILNTEIQKIRYEIESQQDINSQELLNKQIQLQKKLQELTVIKQVQEHQLQKVIEFLKLIQGFTIYDKETNYLLKFWENNNEFEEEDELIQEFQRLQIQQQEEDFNKTEAQQLVNQLLQFVNKQVQNTQFQDEIEKAVIQQNDQQHNDIFEINNQEGFFQMFDNKLTQMKLDQNTDKLQQEPIMNNQQQKIESNFSRILSDFNNEKFSSHENSLQLSEYSSSNEFQFRHQEQIINNQQGNSNQRKSNKKFGLQMHRRKNLKQQQNDDYVKGDQQDDEQEQLPIIQSNSSCYFQNISNQIQIVSQQNDQLESNLEEDRVRREKPQSMLVKTDSKQTINNQLHNQQRFPNKLKQHLKDEDEQQIKPQFVIKQNSKGQKKNLKIDYQHTIFSQTTEKNSSKKQRFTKSKNDCQIQYTELDLTQKDSLKYFNFQQFVGARTCSNLYQIHIIPYDDQIQNTIKYYLNRFHLELQQFIILNYKICDDQYDNDEYCEDIFIILIKLGQQSYVSQNQLQEQFENGYIYPFDSKEQFRQIIKNYSCCYQRQTLINQDNNYMIDNKQSEALSNILQGYGLLIKYQNITSIQDFVLSLKYIYLVKDMIVTKMSTKAFFFKIIDDKVVYLVYYCHDGFFSIARDVFNHSNLEYIQTLDQLCDQPNQIRLLYELAKDKQIKFYPEKIEIPEDFTFQNVRTSFDKYQLEVYKYKIQLQQNDIQQDKQSKNGQRQTQQISMPYIYNPNLQMKETRYLKK